MADARPSPPKKRRTDNGPVSAEAIAQANSTLQLFTGQRHNRWMQGLVPPSSAPTNGGSAAPAKERVTNAGTFARDQCDISSFPEGNSVGSSSTEGVTRHTEMEARGVNFRQHESSASINIVPAAPGSVSRSLDNTARAAAHPGLPSPAASDENNTSPTIGGPHPPKQLGIVPQSGLNTTRTRPPSINHGHPSVASAGSPRLGVHHSRNTSQQQARSRTSSGPNPNANRAANAQSSPVQLMPNIPGQEAHLVPSQPFFPMQQSPYQAQDVYLAHTSMLQRFQEFQTHHASRQKINGVDSGRLALLGEAIEKNDLFYIVLSQIHALTPTPEFIPKSAQVVEKISWQYLDYLICSPNVISPPVLNWLQTFPAPILKIYFSTQSAAIYEPQVLQVVEFLQLLPQHWDRITSESQSRESPPLVEDLYDILHLPSPVFHITAFRAIARLILDSSKFAFPEKGIDRLEVLFKMDQRWFAANGRRSLEEKNLAYRAFRNTKEAWRRHEEKMRERDRQLPNQQRPPPPLEFAFPADVNLAFQHRVTLPSQLIPSGVVATTHPQHQAPTQMPRGPSASGFQAMQPQPTMRQQPRVRQPRNSAAAPQQAIPASAFVFPREGEMPRAQPTNPDPIRSALHQAHLRSPTLTAAVPEQPDSWLYRQIVGWALSPKKLTNDNPVQTLSFSVPQDNFDRIPITVPSDRPGERPSRSLTEFSHTYRLRCAPHPPHGYPTEPSWVGAENYWPDDLYLEFNGIILEPRRKLHHSRHLPIDLTDRIKVGENTIKATINRVRNDPRPFEYVLAVEIIGVMSHESIKKQLRTVSAAETLAAIKKSLSSKGNNDDIAVTSSNLTIKLFDPYSHSKIFDTPVRGSACAHKDCFDLETFLSMCKREKPGWPTVVDCWRCPLCRGDVRPQTLVIDGFLQEVRAELEKRNLLNTRAIVIEADGSWKPREEERTGVRSPSLEREERERSERVVSVGESRKKKQAEIIEID